MRTGLKMMIAGVASLVLLAPLVSNANAESRNGRALPSRQMMHHRPMMHHHYMMRRHHMMRHRPMMRHHSMMHRHTM